MRFIIVFTWRAKCIIFLFTEVYRIYQIFTMCVHTLKALVTATATAKNWVKNVDQKKRMLTKWEKFGRMSQPEPWLLNLLRVCIETRPGLETAQENEIVSGARNHIRLNKRERELLAKTKPSICRHS